MAYTDLFGSNVLAYWSYDGQLDPDFGTYDSYTLSNSPQDVSFSANGLNDLSFLSATNDNTLCATQSASNSNYDEEYSKVSFESQPLNFPYTFEFWYAWNKDTDSSSSPISAIDLTTLDGSSAGYIRAQGSALSYPVGSISGGSTQQRTVSGVFAENTWNHIAIVYPDNDGTNVKAYVNGVLIAGPITTVSSPTTLIPKMESITHISSPSLRTIGSSGGSGDFAALMVQDGVVYNRALSKYEIAQRYNYVTGDPDLYATIAAKNPYVWLKLDNIVPGDATIFNDGSWQHPNGNIDSAQVKAPITYNIDGIESTEGIRHSYNGTSSQNALSLPAVKEGVRAAMWDGIDMGRTGYTVEWWQKTPPQVPNVANMNKRIVGFNGSSAQDFGSFYLDTGYRSATNTDLYGVPNARFPYISSTNGSWLSGSMSGQEANTRYIRYDDNDWHHMVFTFRYWDSGTGKEQIASIYVDGSLVRKRQLTTNSSGYGNWGVNPPTIDEFINYEDFYIGAPQTLTDDGRVFEYDNFVFYNKELSITEIKENYLAWATTPYPQPPVVGQTKYWDGAAWQLPTEVRVFDGTNWVDWTTLTRQRWDGTQWVTL